MRKSWVILAILTLAGFLVRLILLRFEFVINPDGVAYTKLAERFYEGNWTGFLDPYWSPLYPFLMSLVMPFTSDIELPGLIVSIVFSSVLPIPVFFLVREIYSETEGVIASTLAAFYGHYLNLAIGVTPSALYYFLFAMVVWCGWKALQKQSLRQVVMLGVWLGLAYLTRPEAIGYVPIFAVFILAGFFVSKKLSLKKRGLLVLVLLFSFLLIAAPYLIYLRETTGHWTISAKVMPHLVGGNFAETSAFGESQIPPDTFAGTIKAVFSTLLYNFHKQHKIFSYLFPPILIFLAVLGLFGGKWTGNRRKHEIYLLLLFLATFTAYLVTVVELVYMATYLVILLAWAAKGITQLHQWLDENLPEFRGGNYVFGKLSQLFPVICVILLIIYSLPFLGVFRNQSQDREFLWREVKTAGLWLEKNVAPKPKIMAFASQIPFYARGEHFPLKAKTSAEILEVTRKEKVDFIIISERTEKDLADWLNGTPNSTEVKEIYRDESRPGCKLIIYRILR